MDDEFDIEKEVMDALTPHPGENEAYQKELEHLKNLLLKDQENLGPKAIEKYDDDLDLCGNVNPLSTKAMGTEEDEVEDDGPLNSKYSDLERKQDIMDLIEDGVVRPRSPDLYKYEPPNSSHRRPGSKFSIQTGSPSVVIEKAATGESEKIKPEKSNDGKRYPTQWMRNDHDINKLYEKNPFIFDILNYIHDYTRYYNNDQIEMMIFEATPYKRYMKVSNAFQKLFKCKDGIPSTFIINNEFYDKMSTKLGIPKRKCQRYVRALSRLEVIMNIGKSFNGDTLCIDGYFRYGKKDDPRTRRKEPFLKEKSRARKRLPDIMKVANSC